MQSNELTQEAIYDRPCSKCGQYLRRGQCPDRLGDLADHRVCAVSEARDGQVA